MNNGDSPAAQNIPAEPDTTKCPGCGGPVDLNEKRCPHCGRPAAKSPTRFFIHVMGRVINAGGGIDRLYFLRWVSDVEPDALRKAVAEVADFSSCLNSAEAYDVHHVRQVLVRAQSICMSHHHAEPRAPARRRWFGKCWLDWQTTNTKHYVESIFWSFARRRSTQVSAAAAQTTV